MGGCTPEIRWFPGKPGGSPDLVVPRDWSRTHWVVPRAYFCGVFHTSNFHWLVPWEKRVFPGRRGGSPDGWFFVASQKRGFPGLGLPREKKLFFCCCFVVLLFACWLLILVLSLFIVHVVLSLLALARSLAPSASLSLSLSLSLSATAAGC